MRIALSAKQLSVYIRVQKGISYTIKLNSLTPSFLYHVESTSWKKSYIPFFPAPPV